MAQNLPKSFLAAATEEDSLAVRFDWVESLEKLAAVGNKRRKLALLSMGR